MSFLSHRDDARDLPETGVDGVTHESLFIGRGAGGLEVAHFTSTTAPSAPQLRELHSKRHRGRPAPVVVVVTHGRDRAALATRFGDDWTIKPDLPRSQVERLCAEALDAPDRHAADVLLRSKLPQLDQRVPGLRNAGLFALHELEEGVPHRTDWTKACADASRMLSTRGRELIERLGFVIEPLPHPVSVLRAKGTRVAVAVFLERLDEIEPANLKFDGLSPVSYALAKADAENVDYVVVSAGSILRIYPVRPGVGTARRGRTETFVALDLALLDDRTAGYLTLLASAAALLPEGSFASILDASKRFAADLGARLRDRIYDDVMPRLAEAFYRAQRLRNPSRERLHETFEMALLTLFRLLFVAYAEDKELLPYHTSETYREHSLKRMAQRLADEASTGVEYGDQDFYWTEVAQLWKAVDKGNRAWRVPAYNGGLFAGGSESSKPAQRLGDTSLSDAIFAPALASLLLDATPERAHGPVDFRALGVREFGTIYEGLLEQELSVAEQDLVVDSNGAYVPTGATRGRGRAARERDAVVVRTGEVYLHDKSGARKASGAYYTKDFAVEHLLERALEPALAEHLARLTATYDAREAADRFFDFHVADIAMGSGHFLVAAVDHLERGLSSYLAKRPLPGVRDELARLRKVSADALGEDWRGDPIEDMQLLRRQIARRCVHGVDLNPLAVELARLSLWIHTFVPGLPLSFLDANLVVGNSLVGIATLEEARELMPTEDLFSGSAEELLGRAKEPLAKLGRLAEATAAEVKDARKLYEQMQRSVSSANELFTVLAASRIDEELAARVAEGNIATRFEAQGTLDRERWVRRAERALAGLRPLHFPVAFPQVFLRRERPGFDVIIGNPPWEKLHVEEHEFWARHFPGYRGKTQAERERQLPAMERSRPDLVVAFEKEREAADALRAVLLSGSFPGMGSGHPDLYKAFCWRFWMLVAIDGGRLGVVLPRAVFAAKGSEQFRRRLLEAGALLDVTTLVNNRGWVFDNVHPQYSIALSAVQRRSAAQSEVRLTGPFASRAAFQRQRVAEPAVFTYPGVQRLSTSLALPLVSSERGAKVMELMARSRRFGDQADRRWRLRPLQGDFNSTTAKPLMDFQHASDKRLWPVYAGESFDIWDSDTGRYYAAMLKATAVETLQQRRLESFERSNSPFSEFARPIIDRVATLSCLHARVAFRRISRATDTRTVRAALVPPRVALVDTAPYFLRPRGSELDEAFVLGVMCSIPFDWFARRFVETHLDFHVLDEFPVPATGHHLEGWIVTATSRLAIKDDARFKEWGAAVGVEPTPLAEDEKNDLIHELDAAVAHLYGLEERDLVHIFETFHEGWNYQDRLDATLRHFVRLRS